MMAMRAMWQTNRSLAAAARLTLPRRGQAAVSVVELTTLVMLGALAAIATSFAMGGLRLPGHAILRGTLPLIFGLSLVPRRTAGTVMSMAAATTFAALRMGGLGLPNPAAWVGLLCLGPAMDAAVAGARGGWRLYTRFAAAGLVANLAAFAVRMASTPLGAAAAGHIPGSGGGRGMGGGHGMGRGGGPSVVDFWPTALASFALFGAIAGLVCAMIWFRARPRAEDVNSPRASDAP
jgi:hypothetical protein